MITLKAAATTEKANNPKGSLAALKALKTRCDNALDKLRDDDPGRGDLQAKSEGYAQRIAALIKDHPELAALTSNKRRSSSRSRRFLDQEGNVDRAEIMARYHNAQAGLHAHIARLFPVEATEPAKPAMAAPKKPAAKRKKAA